MTYKGYKAEIKYDSDANTFYGEILNSSAIIHFRGDSVEELEKSFNEGIDEYLQICEEEDITPERPFSGEFRVRISPDLHKKVFLQSKKEHLSINKFAIKAFEEKITNSEIESSNVDDTKENSFFQNLMQENNIKITTSNDSDFESDLNSGNEANNLTNNIIDFPTAV
jgi:predicted HicB family RNase H-like nuclease